MLATGSLQAPGGVSSSPTHRRAALPVRAELRPLCTRVAFGGAEHSETILAACLAAAERNPDDGSNGVLKQDFMERLAASISQDQARQPDYYGYNAEQQLRALGRL